MLFSSRARRCLALGLGLGLLACAVSAQTSSNKPEAEEKPAHRGPPPEALAACKNLSSGKECTFTTPKGTLTGNCMAPPDKALACRPKNAPMPPEGGNPPKS